METSSRGTSTNHPDGRSHHQPAVLEWHVRNVGRAAALPEPAWNTSTMMRRGGQERVSITKGYEEAGAHAP